MLKGKWLAKLNLQIGDYISVSCEDGRLVVTKTESEQNYYKRRAEDEFLCTYSFTQTKNALHKQNVFRNSFYTWQMSYYQYSYFSDPCQ